MPRKLQYVVRVLKKLEVRIHNKLVCFEPNLRRKMGKMSFPDGMGVYSGMPVKKKFDVKGKIKDKLKNLKREKYKFLASVDDPNDEDEEEIEYIQAL